jgi:hypothetical protein
VARSRSHYSVPSNRFVGRNHLAAECALVWAGLAPFGGIFCRLKMPER